MADHVELLSASFPSVVQQTLAEVCGSLRSDVYPPHFERNAKVTVCGESLSVLSRTFFNAAPPGYQSPEGGNAHRFRLRDERVSLIAARPRSREVYACIQSRDCSGYRRIEYVGLVLNGTHEWSIPFLFQLATDYVPAISERVFVRLPTLTALRKEQIRAFAAQNAIWLNTLAHQVVTRWDWHAKCWYREAGGVEHYERLGDFPAYRTLSHFGLWPQKVGYRPLRAV